MIARGRQECTADGVMGLAELPDGRFRSTVVIGELHRPSPGQVGIVGRRACKEAVILAQGGLQRHVLILVAQLDQEKLAPELIAHRIGGEYVLVSRHAYFQMGAVDFDLAQQQAFLAVHQKPYRLRILSQQIQSEGQLAAGRLQYDTVAPQLDVRGARCACGVRRACGARRARCGLAWGSTAMASGQGQQGDDH
jgi:hypothetical protein